jgi:hypothetical protein
VKAISISFIEVHHPYAGVTGEMVAVRLSGASSQFKEGLMTLSQ